MTIRCFVRLSFTLDNCDRPVRLVLPLKRQRPALWSDAATNFDEEACQILKQKGIFLHVCEKAQCLNAFYAFLSYHKEEVNINLGDKWRKLSSSFRAYQIWRILSIKIHVTQSVPF